MLVFPLNLTWIFERLPCLGRPALDMAGARRSATAQQILDVVGVDYRGVDVREFAGGAPERAGTGATRNSTGHAQRHPDVPGVAASASGCAGTQGGLAGVIGVYEEWRRHDDPRCQ